jgi:hypothetical protein
MLDEEGGRKVLVVESSPVTDPVESDLDMMLLPFVAM